MTDQTQRPTTRSRRYPTLSLEQAIKRARELYDAERFNPAPISVIAHHWGYKSHTSGPAGTTYSAVKQYGLIDESGSGDQRKAAISQRARAILTAPADVKEKHIKEAALEPPMNRTVWERYGADTGSIDAFKWHLISELGFSDTGASEFAKQYVATLRFAGLDKMASPDDADAVDPELQDEEDIEPEPEQTRRQPDRPRPDRVDFSSVGPSSRVSRHAIPLVGGQQVILEGEFPLTESAWKGFLGVLEAFKPGLVAPDPVKPFTDDLFGFARYSAPRQPESDQDASQE